MSCNIDHIFYINLDKRTDRKEKITHELKKMHWKAERFSAIYASPPKGTIGCGKSHLSVLRLAKERKYKNVLILEDDFVFTESPLVVETELTKLFHYNPGFDVCFLAYNLHHGEVVTNNMFLVKTTKCSTASAYIVNGHYYDKIIELYEYSIPELEKTMKHWIYANDQIWHRLQEKDRWYCFAIRLGRQSAGFSDNANQVIDYSC